MVKDNRIELISRFVKDQASMFTLKLGDCVCYHSRTPLISCGCFLFLFYQNKYMYQFGKPIPRSLPTIVGSFKSAVARHINRRRGTPGRTIWQRGYYEHAIRTEHALRRIRRYIAHNPQHWHLDVPFTPPKASPTDTT